MSTHLPALILFAASACMFAPGIWRIVRNHRKPMPTPVAPESVDGPRKHVVEVTAAEWDRIRTESGWALTLAEIDALPERKAS